MKKQILHFAVFASFLMASFICVSGQAVTGINNTAKATSLQWRYNLLKDENGNYNPAYAVNAIRQADERRSLNRSSGLGLQWQELGPYNTGGETRAILIDRRDTTNNTIYAGSVAGGLWKSTDGANTWVHLPGFGMWMAISCITQGPAPDYNIYVGTGPGWDGIGQEGTSFASAQYGNGVFKVSAGDSAILLTPTIVTGNFYNPSGSSPWSIVNSIAVNPANPAEILAGTLYGIYKSVDTGLTWALLSVPATNNNMVGDIKWSADGNNIYVSYAALNAGEYGMIYSDNGGTTWSSEGSGNTNFPASPGRIGIAVTPANPQIVYILVATPGGGTRGLYKSSDGGNTWSVLATGGASFQLFEVNSFGGVGGQGGYDLAIAVSPVDTNDVYMGGVNFYTYSPASGLQPVGPFYQESDYLAITIADNNPDIMMVGCDGGIFKSNNALTAFINPALEPQDEGYNAVLNYGIGAGIDGSVIGGSQNSGTNYVSFSGDSPGVAVQGLPYDGFFNAVSQINPEFYYAAYNGGDLQRSPNHASTFGTYFDSKIDPLEEDVPTVCGASYSDGDAQYCTPYYLGETLNAVGGNKQVTYTATDRTHYAGEVIPITSATGGYQFEITLSDSVSLDSSILVGDPIRSRMFMSATCGVFLTSQPLLTNSTPQWFQLTNKEFEGQAQSLVSTIDGNNLYIGTNDGYVYRFSNLNIHADTCVYPFTSAIGVLYAASDSSIQTTAVCAGRSIEGIDVDATDNNHVVIVVAGFSNSNQPHVYESHDGGLTWVADTAGLPNMPCYSIVIHSPSTFIMGTEFGVWTWDGSSWSEDDANVERVPVYRMIERNLRADGCPVLYIGTHGRGMWRSTTLTPADCNTAIETAVKNVAPNITTGLNVFPNPVNGTANLSISLSNPSSVDIKVYDLVGKLYSEKAYQNVSPGTSIFTLDVSRMSNGLYIVAATIAGTGTLSRLFVVAK